MRLPVEDHAGVVATLLLGRRSDNAPYSREERDAIRAITEPLADALRASQRNAAFSGAIAELKARMQELERTGIPGRERHRDPETREVALRRPSRYMAAMTSTLKIASWNINSIRARAEIVAKFLVEESPDILCLQETKVRDSEFPYELFKRLGYDHVIICGQPMHHGVAIASRVPMREDDRRDWQDNGEARHVGVRLESGIRLENVYVPAGGDIPDRALNPKFGQKLDFIERMTRWSETCGCPTIMVGDFNVAPLECDVWSHKQLINVVSHTPVEVDALTRLQASNDWIDLGRHFHPAPQRLHTWWSYRSPDWTKNDRGRRLDHMWATGDVAKLAKGHRVYEPIRNWTRPSDHVPLMTEFSL